MIGSPPAPQPATTDYLRGEGQTVRLQCPLPVGADRVSWEREGGVDLPRSARESNNGATLEYVHICTSPWSTGTHPFMKQS